jgi:hypothetical protein
MRSLASGLACVVLGSSVALAAPLVPCIESHDFNFGASEGGFTPAFYEPRGADPDYLTLAADPADREVTAFWEIWPNGSPLPIFNAQDQFGGDFELYLEFDGEDATPPPLDVSITGTGRNAGADLIISGKMPDLGIVDYQLLVAIDVQLASLYGYGDESSFVLETAGVFTAVNPLLPGADWLVGESAVSRGNIDYLELALPSGYDPLADYGLAADGGGYSGEVGRGYPTPEPASLLTLLVGTAVALRRRQADRR